MAFKYQHVKSNVEGKRPNPENLAYGQIAVNYNAGNEFLSIKNDEDEIAAFPSETAIDEKLSDKVDVNDGKAENLTVHSSFELVGPSIDHSDGTTNRMIVYCDYNSLSLTTPSKDGEGFVKSYLTPDGSDVVTKNTLSDKLGRKVVIGKSCPFMPRGHNYLFSNNGVNLGFHRKINTMKFTIKSYTDEEDGKIKARIKFDADDMILNKIIKKGTNIRTSSLGWKQIAAIDNEDGSREYFFERWEYDELFASFPDDHDKADRIWKSTTMGHITFCITVEGPVLFVPDEHFCAGHFKNNYEVVLFDASWNNRFLSTYDDNGYSDAFSDKKGNIDLESINFMSTSKYLSVDSKGHVTCTYPVEKLLNNIDFKTHISRLRISNHLNTDVASSLFTSFVEGSNRKTNKTSLSFYKLRTVPKKHFNDYSHLTDMFNDNDGFAGRSQTTIIGSYNKFCKLGRRNRGTSVRISGQNRYKNNYCDNELSAWWFLHYCVGEDGYSDHRIKYKIKPTYRKFLSNDEIVFTVGENKPIGDEHRVRTMYENISLLSKKVAELEKEIDELKKNNTNDENNSSENP